MAARVLIADDEPCITDVVSRKLRKEGFEVIVAADGQEAYELAMAERPDFIITDLQMPRMSGLELCVRLAAELAEPVPILMLTAKGFELDPAEIARLPILAVMTKPFSPRELRDKVCQALQDLRAP
ncbi:MAG: response regulator [Planctomycetes bacterium]|nr:response regulator [Planctomycetota bacterium]